MKDYKKILVGFYAIVLCLLWTGCAYDRSIPSPYQYSTIYIPQAYGGAIFNQLAVREENDEFSLGAAFGGLEQLESDAKITFKVADELINEYNDINQTDYLKMPEGSYELSGTEVTINKGTTTSDLLELRVKTFGNLEIGNTYLLAITISDVSVDVPVNPKLKTIYYIIEAAAYKRIDRTSWLIHDISGDEDEGAVRGGRGRHSIDGDVNSIWSTPWRATTPPTVKLPPPYYITYDMGKRETLYGAIVIPRRANNGDPIVYNVNGVNISVPKDITIEISDDGVVWSLVTTAVLPIKLENEIFFDKAARGRYLKLTINSIYNAGGTQATLAEFYAF